MSLCATKTDMSFVQTSYVNCLLEHAQHWKHSTMVVRASGFDFAAGQSPHSSTLDLINLALVNKVEYVFITFTIRWQKKIIGSLCLNNPLQQSLFKSELNLLVITVEKYF